MYANSVTEARIMEDTMAQTPHDFFKLPFRAFGVDLKPDIQSRDFKALDIASGQIVTFFFASNRYFGFVVAEPSTGRSTALLEQAGFMEDQVEQLILLAARNFIPNGAGGHKATSLTELIEVFEPEFAVTPPYLLETSRLIRLSEDEYKIQCEVLFRFLRFIERGEGPFEQHYRLTEFSPAAA